jgi:hypothetical protein
MVVSWVDIFRHWDADGQRILRALAAVFPTAAALVGCGALLYVEGRGSVGRGAALSVYGDGLFLALIGTTLGIVAMVNAKRWSSILGLCTSTWLLAIFGLMASATD